MSQTTQNNYYAQLKRSRWITTLIFILILFFGSLFALRGNSGAVTVQVNDTMLGVIGTYGSATFIPLEEIEALQLIERLDVGTQVEGETTNDTHSGRYSNREYGEYTLHIYTDKAPYILVQYSGGNTLVFNLGRASLTDKTFEELQTAHGK